MEQRREASVFNFNQELAFGEIGSFGGSYTAAYLARALHASYFVISGSLVAGTLLGGTMMWLLMRIHHRIADRRWSLAGLAHDIGYFTPAALVLGFAVYDPAIFFASHHLLVGGLGIGHTVLLAQLFAFTLFLASMNLYRALLLKTRGKRL